MDVRVEREEKIVEFSQVSSGKVIYHAGMVLMKTETAVAINLSSGTLMDVKGDTEVRIPKKAQLVVVI